MRRSDYRLVDLVGSPVTLEGNHLYRSTESKAIWYHQLGQKLAILMVFLR